jgi:serine/threonine protein kinase
MDGGALIGGALIGRGSFGCVFKPAFKCPGEKNTKDNIVSKVFFNEESKKEALEEMNIDSKINKIKGYEQWSHIWNKNCIPPKYDVLYEEDKEIKDCLRDNDIDEYEFDKYRRMLQGTYAGISLLDSLYKDFKSSTFTNKNKFTTLFLKYMKLMKPLFIGLISMYNKGITHNDIKDENIMIDNEGCKYIDFGLACEFKDRKFYEKRSKSEFIYDRIYPSYPYEYIYLYASPGVLQEEQDDIKQDVYRSLHDRYELVHEQIFKRKTREFLINLIDKLIKRGKIIQKDHNGKQITSLIDTYSLGMLIPSTLCKLAKKYSKMNQLKKLVTSSKINSFIDLFKHMTEPNHYDRIKPSNVYNKYLELEKLYLTSSPKKERGNKKRTKRK